MDVEATEKASLPPTEVQGRGLKDFTDECDVLKRLTLEHTDPPPPRLGAIDRASFISFLLKNESLEPKTDEEISMRHTVLT